MAVDVSMAVLAFLAVNAAGGGGAPLVAAAFVVLLVLIHKLVGLYDRDELLLNRTTLDELPQLLQSSAVASLCTWLLCPPLVGIVPTSGQGLGVWVSTFALLALGRGAGRRLLRMGAVPQRCLAVGDERAVDTIADKLASPAVDAVTVAALVVDGGRSPALLSRELCRLIEELHIDRVVLAPQSTDGDAVLELIRVAKVQGVRVTVLPRLLEVVGSTVVFDQVDGLTMLGVRRFGLSRAARALKRAFDLVGAGVLLALTLPLMAAIAGAIVLDSRGGVFFRQTRVGRDGKRFEMVKFRSMDVDADRQKASLRVHDDVIELFKLPDDPRVTRVGRWLRSSSLDELPQLWNVLAGEMSLVGPRPLVVEEDALVRGLDRTRLHLTPGMTGPWQVLGSTRVPIREMVAIDFLYVANWSLWADVKILLRTVSHVVRNRGM